MTVPAAAPPDARANLPEPAEPADLAAPGKTGTPQTPDAAPEVSELLSEMPWWAARGVLYLILAFVAASTLWAALSIVDVVVVARGALVPEGSIQPVQAAAPGPVEYIAAREGQKVRKGDVLLQMDPTEARTRMNRLNESLNATRQRLEQMRAVNAPLAEVRAAEGEAARLENDVAQAEMDHARHTVRAPVDGVITRLAVRSAGAVLEVGQTVASIAPAGVPLIAEVYVANRDIAYLEPDLPVRVKFDAFPFQDFGSVPGRIVEVGADADERVSSRYRVRVALERSSIPARGRRIPLRPGMDLTAEIVTDRKSILALLLEPLYKLREAASRAGA